jgi:hypothetical protein
MIVSWASLSCLLSHVVFPSWLYGADASRVFDANYCLSSRFSWYNSAIASCACFSCCDGSQTSGPSVSGLLLLSQASQLGPSTGSSRMACMSNSSTVDFAWLFRDLASPVSLFFLGLPLFWSIYCWEDVVANVFPSSTVLLISASAR